MARFSRHSDVSTISVIMHVLTGIALLYGWISTGILSPISAAQETVVELMRIKFVLYAVLFQIIGLAALYVKKS